MANHRLLQKLLYIESTQELPHNFKESIVEPHLFEEPLGSHGALHSFQALCKDKPLSTIAQALEGAFKDPALRRNIETKWMLSCDFEHARRQEENLDKSAPRDLASWTIFNCPECFKFLLGHGAVLASSFCRTGESFFLLAMKSEKQESVDVILSAIDYEQIFQPFWMSEPEYDRKSIIQASTYNEPLFRACWKRVRSHPQFQQNSLGPQERGHICRFVDPGLADDLLDHEVDIAKPHTENSCPGWIELLSQGDASEMFDWFLRRGYPPPDFYLTYVAEFNCVNAVHWILRHTDDYDDWLRACFVSAANMEERSVRMLEAILRSSASKWKPDQCLAENIAITIVDSMSDESNYLLTFHDIESDSIPTLHDMIQRRERIAIQKLHILRDVPGGVSVAGLKVKSNLAGLHGLTSALEELEP